MRKMTNKELDGRAHVLYTGIVASYGLSNAKGIVRRVSRTLKDENNRRKGLK